MKNYTITVNGQTYVVQVEEGITAAAAQAPVVSVPAPAPVVYAPAPAPAAAPSGAAGSITVESPMPGKILSVDKNVGDHVDAGQTIMILEAMKMENEIYTAVAGTVTQLCCKEGDTVSTGDTLLVVA